MSMHPPAERRAQPGCHCRKLSNCSQIGASPRRELGATAAIRARARQSTIGWQKREPMQLNPLRGAMGSAQNGRCFETGSWRYRMGARRTMAPERYRYAGDRANRSSERRSRVLDCGFEKCKNARHIRGSKWRAPRIGLQPNGMVGRHAGGTTGWDFGSRYHRADPQDYLGSLENRSARMAPCHRSSADRRRTIDDGCERRGLEGDSRNAAIAAIGRSGRDCSCCIGWLRVWCSMQHNLCAISLIERGCVAARTCNFFSLSLRDEQIRR